MSQPKTFAFNAQTEVTAVEFSPFNWCESLLAVGTRHGVGILECEFQEEGSVLSNMKHKMMRIFHHDGFVKEIRWNPQTNLEQLPKRLVFLTVGDDIFLKVYFSDLQEDNILSVHGHTDFINDAAFEPHHGEEIASVSDDSTCQIFSLDGERKHVFHLMWPGVSLSYHPSEPGKLMVAQKDGHIKFYDVKKYQAVMSIDANCSTLLCAKWSPYNSDVIYAVAGNEWILWKKSKSCLPDSRRVCHADIADSLEVSKTSEDMFATSNASGSCFKVTIPKMAQPLMTKNKNFGKGLSWHCKLPLLVVGDDINALFYRISYM